MVTQTVKFFARTIFFDRNVIFDTVHELGLGNSILERNQKNLERK